MADTSKRLGCEGEQYIGRYLERQGFAIVALNYTERCGEIDIIARKGELLVFVEVKLRQKRYFALSEVIGYDKQRKITKTARLYIARHRMSGMVYRFDVALLEKRESNYTLTYIPNAFTVCEE